MYNKKSKKKQGHDPIANDTVERGGRPASVGIASDKKIRKKTFERVLGQILFYSLCTYIESVDRTGLVVWCEEPDSEGQ